MPGKTPSYRGNLRGHSVVIDLRTGSQDQAEPRETGAKATLYAQTHRSGNPDRFCGPLRQSGNTGGDQPVILSRLECIKHMATSGEFIAAQNFALPARQAL